MPVMTVYLVPEDDNDCPHFVGVVDLPWTPRSGELLSLDLPLRDSAKPGCVKSVVASVHHQARLRQCADEPNDSAHISLFLEPLAGADDGCRLCSRPCPLG